jgi:hypothetical protein
MGQVIKARIRKIVKPTLLGGRPADHVFLADVSYQAVLRFRSALTSTAA